MKKLVLFFVFVLCATFISSICSAREVVLEKNADGGYSLFEKGDLIQNIQPLPHGVNLDDKKIIKLFTKGGVEEYSTDKEIRLTTLFPLPLKKMVTTKHTISFQGEKGWDPNHLKTSGPEEIDYLLLFLLIILFVSIITKTITINWEGKKIKNSLTIDLLILFAASIIVSACIDVDAGMVSDVGFIEIIGFCLILAVVSIAASTSIAGEGISAGATGIAGIATVIGAIGVVVVGSHISIIQYFAFLNSTILLSYLALYFINKARKTKIEENSIQC